MTFALGFLGGLLVGAVVALLLRLLERGGT
jgi:hypothetical protein